MSSKLKGTITRVSNGSIEFTPENSFDLQKLQPGSVCEVTIDVVGNEEDDRARTAAAQPIAASTQPVATGSTPEGRRVQRT